MNMRPVPSIPGGARVFGSDGRQLGRVDAAFADYLLVRTTTLVPVDLYVPLSAVVGNQGDRVLLGEPAEGAYDRWHRPLKRAPHA
jgi:hypothetical protein